MSLEVTQRFVYESVAQQIPKLFVVYLRAVIPKKFDKKNCTHNFQTRTIYTFIIYKYSLFERTLYTSAKFLDLYSASMPRSSLVICVRYHVDIFVP